MRADQFVFTGTSMFPFLKTGDIIHTRKTPWSRLQIGDVVVVTPPDSTQPIIHRLVRWQRCNNSICGILKGDSLIYKDHFFLSQHNYSGRVWARDRNGKLLHLDGLHRSIRARFIAFLSVLNLTPGVFRLKIKRELVRIMPRIPGIKLIEHFFLERVQYYFFSGQRNTRRLCIVYQGLTVGEIIFQDRPFRVISNNVFSIFSSFISAEKLVSHVTGRFPELFHIDVSKNCGD